ncbi:MAG: PhnD/SsuA/transferrin family substrate-binding protein [Alphaproteobacteria bacterium]|jgi:phosphate/phosphite/phosphonate ABC transporter binding protein|nr:PhnD/SsuA/transferrin family substrate-binding protein [Alphaproteobacteria bacterium]MBU0803279.1 PhnD/SsuA/transferrin family substrate-binding protein [Alphaproteobacteria bacterium]MBU0870803.1 PhnD/SsuA/transferrin family substrate-binding protein [Alphaproteobacteria bacterium]MBU1403759.1 PhnD/SsuA/transferrin family substrate-binding protein [Alphaproteobacteria bacterium]MBU1589594.1 PhnD/SsuA/transferrin family substrate-binding protein [Alphaproteobacteria bacterium]
MKGGASLKGLPTLDVAGRKWSRRAALRLAGAGALCAGGGRLARAQPQEVIRFGLTPVFLTNDLELLNALQAYLATETGYEIELITRRTYQEVTALLVSGQLDAAWICGYPFVHYRDQLELVAVPDWNGKPLYQSYLIVSSERQATSLDDLAGDIHAFSDPDSNSGYLVTRTLLFERGLDPDVFFRKTMFTYGHRNVIRAVASGLAQSGSVDGYVWEVMREIEPDLVNRTRPLRKSEWLGFPPVATSKALAHSRRIDALTRALLSMAQSQEGQRVLGMLRLTGFENADPSIFDGIATKVAMLRGVL